MSASLSPVVHWPAKSQYPKAERYIWLYAVLVLVPLGVSLLLPLYHRPPYQVLVTILNITGLSALLWQFILSARSSVVAKSWGLDPALSMHRRVGEWIAIFFFLHPFLIVLPRMWVAGQLALGDFWETITQKSMATGLYAWALMLVWTLVSISKSKARMSYEAWRYSHAVGFMAVAILGVLHAMDVGRHGQAQPLFNIFWIAGLVLAIGLTLYALAGRPASSVRQPFLVQSVEKAGSSDWSVRLHLPAGADFSFEAGQFVWISTGPAWVRSEHPFSIASAPAQLPVLELLIRDLGDFTKHLGALRAGQEILVEGPYGQFTLGGRSASGLLFLAGGAGIGPMLGLLRDLKSQKPQLPVRLLYGNRRADQMVALQELAALEKELPDFKTHYALETADSSLPHVYHGRMDSGFLRQYAPYQENYLAYVCGPPVMVQASVAHLKALGWPKDRIIYESFGF